MKRLIWPLTDETTTDVMIDLLLYRVASNGKGTFGVLLWRHQPFALSLEDQWKNNKRRMSCIPAGTYSCKRVNSPKFGDTFEVTGVQGRTHILFHKGNTHKDTEGCILIGEEFGSLNGEPAVLASRKGFVEFQKLTSNLDSFILGIRDYWV